MLFQHTGAVDFAVKIGSYQQLDRAGIAVRRGGFHHSRHRLTVFTCQIQAVRGGGAE
ncbi:hypothetical protein D3C80_1776070 [compost metagenome]